MSFRTPVTQLDEQIACSLTFPRDYICSQTILPAWRMGPQISLKITLKKGRSYNKVFSSDLEGAQREKDPSLHIFFRGPPDEGRNANYHMTRTAPRAISLENHKRKGPV